MICKFIIMKQTCVQTWGSI